MTSTFTLKCILDIMVSTLSRCDSYHICSWLQWLPHSLPSTFRMQWIHRLIPNTFWIWWLQRLLPSVFWLYEGFFNSRLPFNMCNLGRHTWTGTIPRPHANHDMPYMEITPISTFGFNSVAVPSSVTGENTVKPQETRTGHTLCTTSGFHWARWPNQ